MNFKLAILFIVAVMLSTGLSLTLGDVLCQRRADSGVILPHGNRRPQ
jgi:hypothetical protein